VRRGGEIVELTTKEYTMLAYLARNHGKIVGRAELTEHVWDNNHDPATNAVEVYINRLRKKLDRPGFTPLIQTRRGSGYYLGVSSSGGEG
jgi:two-component system copper resistance phosphate regulon response regulator CusR